MSPTYPLVVASTILRSYNEVSSHRHHPDAKPLDEAIQEIAKEKLGMKSFDGIQVVDDLQCGELSKSWSFFSLAKPVIAVQKGLEEVAPQARKYLILTELHKCNSSFRLMELTSRVALTFLLMGVLSTGGGMVVVGAKFVALAMTSSIIDSMVRGHFTQLAHDFAIKEIDDKGKMEIKKAYAAMQEFRKENKLLPLRVLNEVSSPDFEECGLDLAGCTTDDENKTLVVPDKPRFNRQCLKILEKISASPLSAPIKENLTKKLQSFAQALLEDSSSSEELYEKMCAYLKDLETVIDGCKKLLEPIQNKFTLASTGLDLPYQLRPAMDKSEFYQARESYHLKDFEEKKQTLDIATAFVSLGAFAALTEALPQVNFLLVAMAANTVVEPIINHVNYRIHDWMFARSTEVPRPETIDPTVWRGAL